MTEKNLPEKTNENKLLGNWDKAEYFLFDELEKIEKIEKEMEMKKESKELKTLEEGGKKYKLLDSNNASVELYKELSGSTSKFADEVAQHAVNNIKNQGKGPSVGDLLEDNYYNYKVVKVDIDTYKERYQDSNEGFTYKYDNFKLERRAKVSLPGTFSAEAKTINRTYNELEKMGLLLI